MNLSNIPGASSAHYPETPSVNVNLAVPMTPLAGHDRHDNDRFQHMPPSNIPITMPPTPLSTAMDIPSPQLQNIVSTVNLGISHLHLIDPTLPLKS